MVVSLRLGPCSSTGSRTSPGMAVHPPARDPCPRWTIIERARKITHCLVCGPEQGRSCRRAGEGTRMDTQSARAIASIFLMGLLLLAAPSPGSADENKLIAVDANHVAIKGYDTVAYFTD